jgi:hypothetical protein
MAVVISEIVTEVVISPRTTPDAGAPAADLPADAMDDVVRRGTERVLEVLRREWDR